MKRKTCKSLCGENCEGCTRPCVYNIVPLKPGPYCADPVSPIKLRYAKTRPAGVSPARWRIEHDRRTRDARLGESPAFAPNPDTLI